MANFQFFSCITKEEKTASNKKTDCEFSNVLVKKKEEA
ncbi:hypothetical protein T01_1607 [Trichinella spiralis]|uniref:Uncharacterized protein n=1 Tax=Trichinella spiralis TaxID=6334 RepID=A0A0V1AHW4_TRISP|nr:hypothetical protein T01_1607 [Trichinella spiralis]